MKSCYLIFSLFHDDTEYRVSGFYTPPDLGQTSGPPERCYPPEPDDFDVDELYPVDNPDRYLSTTLADELVEKAREKAAEIYFNQKAF